MTRWTRIAGIALGAVIGVAPAASGQATAGTPQRSTFVITAGSDTIAVESFARRGDRVDSELRLRAQGVLVSFSLVIAPRELVSSMEHTMRLPGGHPDAPPAHAGTLHFRDDSVVGETTAPARATQRVAAGRGAMPFVNLSMATAEQLIRRARVIGGARVELSVFAVGGGQVMPVVVTWSSPDTALISIAGVDLRAAVSPDGRVLAAVVPSQSVRFTRTDGVSVAGAPVARPDYSAPPGAPYGAEEVTVQSTGGVTLAGTLTLPKQRGADNRVPAVVLITGSGPQNRDEEVPGIRGYRFFRQIADTLSRRGIAVLRLDDRGVGGSQPGDRPGTTGDFADDVRAALAYLRSRPEIRADQLGLVGHSEGGLIAPMVAHDQQVAAIALLAAPSRPIRRILEFQRRVVVENDTTIPPSKRDSALAALARAADSAAAVPGWLQYIYDYDPLPTARQVRSPVLIVHGSTDLQVTADQALELSSAFHQGGNRDVTIHVFTNTNHLFLEDPRGVYSGYATLPSTTVKAEVLGTLADWIVTKLGGP
jgi:dipeptidyl aminopeptidase/acylaminoacyl peptidase